MTITVIKIASRTVFFAGDMEVTTIEDFVLIIARTQLNIPHSSENLVFFVVCCVCSSVIHGLTGAQEHKHFTVCSVVMLLVLPTSVNMMPFSMAGYTGGPRAGAMCS